MVERFCTYPPVDSTLAIWREINNCSETPEIIKEENGILGKKWPSSDGQGDIVLYTIETCMHDWPTFDKYGISATDEIWNFFKLHTRHIETNIDDQNIHSIPKDFKLYQNYPNPFNPSTVITYKVKKSSHIKLKIYNLMAQEIETLVNEYQQAGLYEIVWRPKGLSNGIYFYRLQAADPSSSSPLQNTEQEKRIFAETKKLILQK
jgi:hypothetical protein